MKILLLQLKRIGDLVLTTPAIRALRDAYPSAHLTLVVDASCQSLVEGIDVDECWVHHKNAGLGGLIGRGPNAWIARNLRPYRGDWCLDFTGTDRSAWLAFSSGSTRKVTFQRFAGKFLRKRVFSDFVESSVRNRHTADHYTDLLRPLGVERENVPLDLRISSDRENSTGPLLDQAGIHGAYAVIHAGTARPEKYWQAERWAEVGRHLRQRHGLPVVLTGSSDPDEQAHLEKIRSSIGEGCVNLSARTDLLGLASVIRGASIFCGVDTAAMHLADAMRTPEVALFGPTNPYHWRPRHSRNVVLRAKTREPFAPGQKGGAMEEISVGSVTEAVDSLLQP